MRARHWKKGRKGFFGILFGRTVVVIVLLLLQIALLFVGYGLLNEYVYFLNTVLTVLGIPFGGSYHKQVR